MPDRPASPPGFRTRSLTPRQQAFIRNIIEGHSGTAAYQLAYSATLPVADANASRLRKTLKAEIEQAIRDKLSGLAPRAVNKLGALLDHASGRVSLDSAKTILDRTGLAAAGSERAPGAAIQININLDGVRRTHAAPVLDATPVVVTEEPAGG
jgi:hypothetical protein